MKSFLILSAVVLFVSLVRVEVSAKSLALENSIEDLEDENDQDNIIDFSTHAERMFGLPDNEQTGFLVAAYKANSTHNPEELGSYFEGDILIPSDSEVRNGILSRSSRWPGAIVPYEIKGSFSTNERAIIQHAFNEYHTKTCIRFRPRTTERDYISIDNAATGCWSSIGRLGGRQQVNLQSPSCLMTYGTTIHELMHALGFFHEQNRHERDDYVKVLSENVKPGMMVNFAKFSSGKSYAFGIPYDYASVMHYSPRSFSVNGKPTISAILNTPEARLMGQRSGFSKSDVAKINAMYRCKVV